MHCVNSNTHPGERVNTFLLSPSCCLILSRDKGADQVVILDDLWTPHHQWAVMTHLDVLSYVVAPQEDRGWFFSPRCPAA